MNASVRTEAHALITSVSEVSVSGYEIVLYRFSS